MFQKIPMSKSTSNLKNWKILTSKLKKCMPNEAKMEIILTEIPVYIEKFEEKMCQVKCG